MSWRQSGNDTLHTENICASAMEIAKVEKKTECMMHFQLSKVSLNVDYVKLCFIVMLC